MVKKHNNDSQVGDDSKRSYRTLNYKNTLFFSGSIVILTSIEVFGAETFVIVSTVLLSRSTVSVKVSIVK